MEVSLFQEGEPRTRGPVRILFIGLGPTVGDVGIGEATLSEIRKRLPSAVIRVLTDRPKAYRPLPCLEGFNVEPLPEVHLPRGRLERRLNGMGVLRFLARRRWWKVLAMMGFRNRSERERFRECHAWADVVVHQGGPHWNDGWLKWKTLRQRLVHFSVAQDCGTPCVLFGHSFGPFTADHLTGEIREMTRYLLQIPALLIVRDQFSAPALARLGVPEDRVVRAADPAWLLEPTPPPSDSPAARLTRLPGDRPRIGLTVRAFQSMYGFAEEETEGFEVQMAALCDRLSEKYDIVVVPMDTDPHRNRLNDVEVAERIVSRMKTRGTVRFLRTSPTPGELKWMLSSLDALLTIRLHAAIFALGAGVPCLIIGYTDKSADVASQLGLRDWYIPYREFTAEKSFSALEPILGDVAEAAQRVDSVRKDVVRKAGLGYDAFMKLRL